MRLARIVHTSIKRSIAVTFPPRVPQNRSNFIQIGDEQQPVERVRAEVEKGEEKDAE